MSAQEEPQAPQPCPLSGALTPGWGRIWSGGPKGTWQQGLASSWVSDLTELHWAGDCQVPPIAKSGSRTGAAPATEEDRLWGSWQPGMRQEPDLPHLLFSVGWAFLPTPDSSQGKRTNIPAPLRWHIFAMWDGPRLAKGPRLPQPAPKGTAPPGHLAP